MDQTPTTLTISGIRTVQWAKKEDAMMQFNQALTLDKNYIASIYNLGDLLREKHEFERAIPFLKKTIQKNPNHLYAYNSLGLCYEEMGDFEQAIYYYEKSIEIAPKSEWNNAARMRLKSLYQKVANPENTKESQ